MTAGSFAFGWALVPLYDVLCRAAGIGNAEAKAGQPAVHEAVDPNREITIEFLASARIGGQLRISGPKVASMRIHPGQAVRHRVLCQESDRAGLGGAGRSQHLPERHGQVFSQDRMLLLQSAEICAPAKGATCRCGSSSTRSCRRNVDKLTLAYTFYDTTAIAQRHALSSNVKLPRFIHRLEIESWRKRTRRSSTTTTTSPTAARGPSMGR